MAVEEGANQIAAKERKERKDKSATARSRKSAKTLLTNYCLPLTYAFHQSPFTARAYARPHCPLRIRLRLD